MILQVKPVIGDGVKHPEKCISSHHENEKLRKQRTQRAKKKAGNTTTGNAQEEDDSWPLNIPDGGRTPERCCEWENQHGADGTDEKEPPAVCS